MRFLGALRSALCSAALASALSGCSATIDSLGSDPSSNGGSAGTAGMPPTTLAPVKAPSIVNTFNLVLGKSKAAGEEKIERAFEQLFYGDATQVIYNPQGDSQAVIYDALHNDVRTEGIGLAMLITVELGRKDEFDRLWRYSKTQKELQGPAEGYFNSSCGEDTAAPCFDVYGMQLFVLTLMFAHNLWGSTADLPYASDALALLDQLQNKEAHNGGVVMGIGSAFEAESHLVREEPTLANAGYTTRSSLEMPAAYWYWGQATGNPFWKAAASASHAHLVKAADADTGLWPMRSYFDGSPVEDSPGYTQQAYRTQLNLALDALWRSAEADPAQAKLASRVVDFFYGQGIDTYGRTFTTDGTPIETNRAQALISVNGALAVAAPSYPNRAAFVQAVWDQPIPSGNNRYYEGLLYLTSMLILNGQMLVH